MLRIEDINRQICSEKMDSRGRNDACILREHPTCEECISLVASDGIIKACKHKLLKSSSYFEALFKSGMYESERTEIELKEMALHDLQQLVDFINAPSVIHIKNRKELEARLQIASYFNVPDLIELCEVFTRKNVDRFNCVEHYELLWKYIPDRRNILQDVVSVVAANFGNLRFSSQFLDLDREYFFHLINNVLDSPCLIYTKEDEILDFCNNLIDHSSSTDQQTKVIKLLKKIRFPLILTKNLEAFRNQRYSLIQKVDKLLADYLDQIIYMQKTVKPLKPKLCNVRSTNSIGVIVGGLVTKNIPMSSRRCKQFYPTDSLTLAICTNTTSPSIKLVGAPNHKLPLALYEHSACIIDNVLYVAGGQSSYNDGSKYAVSKVFCFDFRIENWSELPSMLEKRALFFLAGVGNCLYAIGGVNKQGEMASVEFLSSEAEQWQHGAPLPFRLHEHAGAILNGKIYVSGGTRSPLSSINTSEFSMSNNLLCYDAEANVWEFKRPMLQARSYHSMIAFNKKLYVIGGALHSVRHRTVTDLSNCECYYPDLDKWTLVHIADSPAFSPAFGCYVLNTLVVFVGGYQFSVSKNQQQNNIWLLQGLEGGQSFWNKSRISKSTTCLIRCQPCCATIFPGPDLCRLAFKHS